MRRKNEYQRKVLKSLNRQLKHRLKLMRPMLSLWNQSHLSNKQRRQSIKSMLHPSQKLRALPNHLTFASWSWNALCFTLNWNQIGIQRSARCRMLRHFWQGLKASRLRVWKKVNSRKSARWLTTRISGTSMQSLKCPSQLLTCQRGQKLCRTIKRHGRLSSQRRSRLLNCKRQSNRLKLCSKWRWTRSVKLRIKSQLYRRRLMNFKHRRLILNAKWRLQKTAWDVQANW